MFYRCWLILLWKPRFCQCQDYISKGTDAHNVFLLKMYSLISNKHYTYIIAYKYK